MAKTTDMTKVSTSVQVVPTGSISTEKSSVEILPVVNFREDSLKGNEFGLDDIARAFIRVLQDLSPETKARNPKYIEGAEPGMFFNTVTKEVYSKSESEGIILVPVHYEPSYTEWAPNRGGFQFDHKTDSTIMSKTTKGGNNNKENVLPNGNVVNRAGLYHLFLVKERPEVNEPPVQEVIWAMGGTQRTISGYWNKRIRDDRDRDEQGWFTPAMFYRAYKVMTWLDCSRPAGEFFSVKIENYCKTTELCGPLGYQIYNQARRLKKMIEEGSVKVDFNSEGSIDVSSDDVPF